MFEGVVAVIVAVIVAVMLAVMVGLIVIGSVISVIALGDQAHTNNNA
jgi:hypothetical protein